MDFGLPNNRILAQRTAPRPGTAKDGSGKAAAGKEPVGAPMGPGVGKGLGKGLGGLMNPMMAAMMQMEQTAQSEGDSLDFLIAELPDSIRGNYRDSLQSILGGQSSDKLDSVRQLESTVQTAISVAKSTPQEELQANPSETNGNSPLNELSNPAGIFSGGAKGAGGVGRPMPGALPGPVPPPPPAFLRTSFKA